MAYTEPEARQTLPWIMVKWGRNRYSARVTGRLAEQASVSPYCLIDGRRKTIKTILGPIFKVPFSVIAKYATSEKALNLAAYPIVGNER